MAFPFADEKANLEIVPDERIPNGKLGVTAHLPFKIVYAGGKGVAARVSPAELEGTVTGPGGEVASKIVGGGASFRVEFKPPQKGEYRVVVTLRETFRRTFTIRVFGATSHRSYLDGDVRVPCGRYHFLVITVDEDGNRLPAGGDSKFQFQINAPEGSFSEFKVQDKKDGTYLAEIQLHHPSTEYEFIALYLGQEISNSPFKVQTMSG